MPPRDEVVEAEEPARRLRHLRAVHPQEVRVHPVADERLARRGLGLRDLALVMREEVVLATRVDVEGLAEVRHRHGRALDMPSRVTAAPRRLPLLQVAGLRRAPEREVERVALVRVDLDAGAGLALVGRLRVQPRAVPGERRRVEVHPVRRDVRVPLRDEALDEGDHRRDVLGRLRDDVRIEDVQLPPIDHELVGVPLGHGERVEVLALRADRHLVDAGGVRVVHEVADVGDVHDLLHAAAEVLEAAPCDVGGQVAVEVTDVLVVVNGRAAVVDADLALPKGRERLHGPRGAVEELDRQREPPRSDLRSRRRPDIRARTSPRSPSPTWRWPRPRRRCRARHSSSP